MKESTLTLHPEEEQLLRYLDGELPPQGASGVRSHLEACWQCRATLEELQNVVSECVQYRKKVLQRHLPAPPAPWADLYRHFDEIDSALEPVLFQRLGHALKSPFRSAIRRWAAVAAALLVLAGLLYRFHQTPSVQASELLRQAVASSTLHPHKPGRIQIRSGNRRLTRAAVLARKTAANPADAETLDSLQSLFQRANYSWSDPLSAQSFQAWRDQLHDKQDQVAATGQAYRIETSTKSAELRQASLSLRVPDLQPLEVRFEFAGQGWVEITEIPDDVAAPSAAGPAEPEPGVTARANHSSPASASRPAPVASEGDELHVVAALHDLGADLGDPLEISRSGAEVRVNGIGIAPARQQQIRDALDALPHVVVRFSEPTPVAETQPAAPKQGAPRPDSRELQARLAQQLGGRANLDEVAAQILDSSEAMMARAFALRRLAETFPVQAARELNAGDRQLLSRLRLEHSAALRQQIAAIDSALQPILAAAPQDRAHPDSRLPSGAWQPATEDLFQSARRLDKLLGVMFGGAPSDIPVDQLPAQLKTGLAQLRTRLDDYERSNK